MKPYSYPIIILGLFLFINNFSFGQIIFDKPQSERIANYDINIKLDIDSKKLTGEQILYWTNPSDDLISELQFHLYLNAFKNSHTTFMKESGGQHRGSSLDGTDSINWGWIDLTSVKLKNGIDLTDKVEFIQPDDGNKYDQTVVRIQLDEPVKPRETIELHINFISKLPKIFARTGFSREYFFVGQWFPKIGVYEPVGMRYAIEGGWNCHQFHSNSEFYSNFGVYNVNITVPQNYVVGATGLLQNENNNSDGTKTLQFRAEDVIDFAWTASPRFLVVEDKWKDVSMKLLIQPEHENQSERHIESVKSALEYFEKHVGKYPFPNVTIIDPPYHGLASGGMEYPTLFTVGTLWNIPSNIKYTEMVAIHEFGHNYFQGLLASNEFEEPWLDEGMNSYFEARIMDEVYGHKTSMINLFGFKVGDAEMQRQGYVGMSNPKIAENFRASWEFKHGGYSALSYSKAATWLTTLDRLIGRTAMDKVLRLYFERWKFKHPSSQDFINIVNEVVTTEHGNKFGNDMNWFFEQVLYGSNICDYKLASISNNPTSKPVGLYDDEKGKLLFKSEKNDSLKMLYESKIVIHRLGEITMPVEVLVHFENGEEILEFWDGKSRTYEFKYNKPEKIVWAKIDPDYKNYIDVNFINNSLTLQPETVVFNKYLSKVIFWIQNILTTMTIFF